MCITFRTPPTKKKNFRILNSQPLSPMQVHFFRLLGQIIFAIANQRDIQRCIESIWPQAWRGNAGMSHQPTPKNNNFLRVDLFLQNLKNLKRQKSPASSPSDKLKSLIASYFHRGNPPFRLKTTSSWGPIIQQRTWKRPSDLQVLLRLQDYSTISIQKLPRL